MSYITEEELKKLDFKEIENYKEKGWDVPIWYNDEYSIFVSFEDDSNLGIWNVSKVTVFDFMLNYIEKIKESHAEYLAGEDW